MPVHRLEQRLARREMPVERADADAGSSGDRLEAGVGPARAEDGGRRFEQQLAVAHRIGARTAGGLVLVVSFINSRTPP